MDSDPLRNKWDVRYRDPQATLGRPSTVLTQYQHLLPHSGKALDLACGLGSNALFLAGKGLESYAWDISAVAIEKLHSAAKRQALTLKVQTRDVIAQPPQAGEFDLIVVSRFLERKLCPAISAALKSGGLLFYQTYTRNKLSSAGPSNPSFLLAKDELLELFSGLEVIAYDEGDEAMLVARKP